MQNKKANNKNKNQNTNTQKTHQKTSTACGQLISSQASETHQKEMITLYHLRDWYGKGEKERTNNTTKMPYSTAATAKHAVAEYEVKKCSQNRLASCGAEGLQFLPIVAEACGGGWGPMAFQTFKAIATAVAARSNEPAGVEYDRLLQCLSVALQRENARAVLRRVPG